MSEKEEKAWRDAAGPGSLRGHDHPYHCSDNGRITEWDSWRSFLEEFSDADVDMNLVVRWDWRPAMPDWNGCERETLEIHMLHQRKGRLHTHLVAVTGKDERSVEEWLAPHWEKLQALWRPISLRGTNG